MPFNTARDTSVYITPTQVATTGVTTGVLTPAVTTYSMLFQAWTGPVQTSYGMAWASSAEFAMPADFTIEGYAYWTVAAGTKNGVWASHAALWSVHRTVAGYLGFFNNTTDLITGPTLITLNAWHHWALTRTGSTITLWLDGVSQGTTTLATSVAAGVIALGSDYGASSAAAVATVMNGYLSEFRMTVGVCRYTVGFTPTYYAWPTTVGGDPSYNSVVRLVHGEIFTPLGARVGSLAGEPSYAPISGSSAGKNYSSPALAGTISGLTEMNGVVIGNHWVSLVDRTTGLLLARTRSNADGTFTFKGLQTGVAKYIVYLIRDVADPSYNVVIYDSITAV